MKGFTLIELLVVMFIMMTLFTVGYANFRGYSRRQQFMASLRRIEGDLRLAQSLASSGTKPAQPALCTLQGYRFEIDADKRAYAIVAVCDAGSPEPYKTVSLGSDISSLAASSPSVLFKVLGQGTDINKDVGSGSLVITLTQAEIGKTGTVTVSSSGEINYVSN